MSVRFGIYAGIVERVLLLVAIHFVLVGVRWPLAGLASYSILMLSVYAVIVYKDRLWRPAPKTKTLNELAAERQAAELGIDAAGIVKMRAQSEAFCARIEKVFRASITKDFPESDALAGVLGWTVGQAVSQGATPRELGRFVEALAEACACHE